MTYEYLGNDELSMDHAIRQGTHDAVADGIRYSILGILAVTAAGILLGPQKARKIITRITGE